MCCAFRTSAPSSGYADSADPGSRLFADGSRREQDYPCAILEIDWYLTHSSRDRRCAVLRALEGAGKELEFWQAPTNWYHWSMFEADLKQLRDTGHIKRRGLWRQSSGENDLEVVVELLSPGVIETVTRTVYGSGAFTGCR